MPKLCAFGCKPAENIPNHRFPNPENDGDRFQAWVALVGGRLDKPSDYEFYKRKIICDRHFTDNDRVRNNRLNIMAIPSLYLPVNQVPMSDVGANTSPGSRENENNLQKVDQVPMDVEAGMSMDVEAGMSIDVGANMSMDVEAGMSIDVRAGMSMDVEAGISMDIEADMSTGSKQNENDFQKVDQVPIDVEANMSIGSRQNENNLQKDHQVPINNNENDLNLEKRLQPDLPVKSAFLGIPASQDIILMEHNYSALSKSRISRKDISKKRITFAYSEAKTWRAKIKQLRSEISRLRKRGKSFKSRLLNAEKISDDIAFKQIVSNMTTPAKLFVHMQLQNSKKPKGRRFTVDEKIMALSLYKKSPKCYRLLYKYFSLPSAKAVKRLLCKIIFNSGINTKVFEKIKNSVSEKETGDKLCSLIFDEMSLTANVSFNMNKDKVDGLVNANRIDFTDHVLVFMVKSIKVNYKQPVAYFFTNKLNKDELTNYIKLVIKNIHETGLIILNTVCDQSSVNVGAITNLVSEAKATYLRQGKQWRHDLILMNEHTIIPLYDAPHLIKGVRNNLLTKDMLYTTNGQEKRVKWEYYQMVYAADKSYGELRLLDKITEEHLDPEKINKMRVKSATQIFSHSVAVVTEHLTARGDLPEECRQLIDVTLLLDNVFDSLNVSTLHIPNGKIFKGPIKNKSAHHELWQNAKKVLKTVKFVNNQKTGYKVRITETVPPSIRNLIKTIEGMEELWKVLNKKYALDAMLTRNFNQDPIENFFGNIRSYGARNVAPNSVAFETTFKALLLNNYSTPHSKRGNCEEDTNECLQNLKFFATEEQKCNAFKEKQQESISFDIDKLIENNCEKDAGQRNYVCGWVLTKCLKKIVKSCQYCRETLLESSDDNNNNNSFIRKKEYTNSKKWLCYPSKEIENCFEELQDITIKYLKSTNVPKTNIKANIRELGEVFINYPFRCATHKIRLKYCFIDTTLNLLINSWCRSINRILSGKIKYSGDDEFKIAALNYYNKHKNYKNRK